MGSATEKKENILQIPIKIFTPEYDQLTSVDKDCTKDEEKVDEHPTGQSGYALGHLSYKAIIRFHEFVGVKYIGPFVTL